MDNDLKGEMLDFEIPKGSMDQKVKLHNDIAIIYTLAKGISLMKVV